MTICNHLIKASEVIGIGPLMTQVSSDQTMRMLYKEKKLWFELHFKNHTTKIESDWISFAEHLTEEQKKSNKQYFDEFRISYQNAVAEIIKIIGNE
jgi:hypothetical protein